MTDIQKAAKDAAALDEIARILSVSPEWSSDELEDIFHVVTEVREVKTDHDFLEDDYFIRTNNKPYSDTSHNERKP